VTSVPSINAVQVQIIDRLGTLSALSDIVALGTKSLPTGFVIGPPHHAVLVTGNVPVLVQY
jgi:hypothetical protein